jgi:hypothetical protein
MARQPGPAGASADPGIGGGGVSITFYERN